MFGPRHQQLASVAVAMFLTITTVSGTRAAEAEWHSVVIEDETNPNRVVSQVTYGVPETDDRRFIGMCTPDSTDNAAIAIFGAPVGHLEPSTVVTLEVAANDGKAIELTGVVHRPEGDEELSGVAVEVPLDHPVWPLMQAARTVTYRANGIAPIRMGMRGSTKAIGMFLGECRELLGIATSEAENEEKKVQGAASCQQFGSLKSRDTGQKVSIRFTNRTQSYRSVMWLDYQGQPQDYRNLNAGESYTQETFVGHPWMMTDGPGNCKEIFVPKRGDRKFDITFE